MIKFYVNQIKMGKMTLEQVPEKYREAVRKALESESNEVEEVETETEVEGE